MDQDKPTEAPAETSPAGDLNRRSFLGIAIAGGVTSFLAGPKRLDGSLLSTAQVLPDSPVVFCGPDPVPVKLRVNGELRTLALEPRVTLLDALREHLGLTGTKKGCNHGECGACTVHLDGRRANACLVLAIAAADKEITTIEQLGRPDRLSPMQQAFIDQDAFQCGFCTPGQIMSAVACVKEGHAGSAEEIREWMSGNLCRCSAYPQIVAAIQQAAAAGG
jgi:xanthine dehydrogenase YagT iron-sulfur-binding subunit